MTLTLRYGVRSEIGHVRDGNEDSGFAGSRLVAVADGMGGAAAGEVASRVVIAMLAGLDEDPPGPDILGALSRAVVSANDELRAMVAGDSELAGMGTTVTALLASDQRLGLVHVGDSRCYLYRNDTLTMVTRDHTLVQELVDAGEISEDEAAVHPKRSMITRVLDGRPDVELDMSVREARAGDRYLLCSDGLSSVVSGDTIAVAMAQPTPQDAADRLVELALRAGGPDNVTVVVADVVDTTGEEAMPTVAGAAAESHAAPTPSENAPGTSAARAARAVRAQREARGLGLRRRVPALVPPTAGPTNDERRVPLLIPGLAVGIVLVVALALLGGWLYVRGQYYVGPDQGNVAIFRGLPGTIGPVHLSSVEERGLPLSMLQPETQRQVEQRINAASRAAAQRIFAQVESQLVVPTSSPAPGSSP